jgi:serine phosphatase RsbU (regulator of sigma subunit)
MQQHTPAYIAQVNQRSDKLTDLFLAGYFLIGLALAAFYGTWNIAIGVGGLTVLAYYLTKRLLPGSDLYQYVLSAGVGIFMAQFIYQMHGMFEMHFFAFIGSAILITYQNWKLQIPLAAVVVVHHAVFGWLQYAGAPVFFTQLEYMSLETFIIHALLAAIIFVLCGSWSYTFRRSSLAHIEQSFEIGRLQADNLHKQELLHMGEALESSNDRNRTITESIQYTQRLQRALFPEPKLLDTHFAGSFVLDRPQGIVGGDFAWFSKVGDEMLVACVDCTGHGVPGAFMSIIAIGLLNRVTTEHPDADPAELLRLLDLELNRTIGLDKKEGVLDGMDLVLCRIDLAARRLRFAGAMNPLVLASGQGVQAHRGSGYDLGGYVDTAHKKFRTVEVPFQDGDMLYLFSDGYVHQQGGHESKKLKSTGLLQWIGSIHHLPVDEQQQRMVQLFDAWKGDHQQIDDALFIGVRLSAAQEVSVVKAA